MSKDNPSGLVGVIGGTEFDAKLGVSFLKQKGLEGKPLNISHNPYEQTLLQLSKKALTSRVQFAIEHLLADECKSIFIYCNSLSGAVDLHYLRKCFDIPIHTPLEAYNNVASDYNLIGLFAANCQSLGNLEKRILSKNPNATIIGFSSLLIVNSIEEGLSSSEIIQKYNFKAICENINRSGAEVIVLGCTHFSYFYNELVRLFKEEKMNISLFDPSETMYENLIKYQEKQLYNKLLTHC